jgi:uncharacterized protein (DUF934 family)
MPKLIELADGQARWADDAFIHVADEDAIPETGDVILSLARFESEGDALLSSNSRRVGVRVESDQEVEVLAYDLPRSRWWPWPSRSTATAAPTPRPACCASGSAIRARVRAVGDVLQEQAGFMVRCGFDAFEPNDGATPEAWTKAASRFRHVYQRAADDRQVAFEERAS